MARLLRFLLTTYRFNWLGSILIRKWGARYFFLSLKYCNQRIDTEREVCNGLLLLCGCLFRIIYGVSVEHPNGFSLTSDLAEVQWRVISHAGQDVRSAPSTADQPPSARDSNGKAHVAVYWPLTVIPVLCAYVKDT